MNTLKIGQHCPVHKGIYAGIVRSFSSEPDNHIWLLDAKSPNELMNWTDAMEWAESLGEATGLPTRHEAVLLGCHLVEELGEMVMCGLALLEKGSEHGVSIGMRLAPAISVVLTRPIRTEQEQ